MKIKNKLIAWIVVLSTLTLLLSGCFKKPAPAPKLSTKKIELVYYKLFDDEDIIKPLIQQYEALHPNVVIIYKKFSDSADYYNTILNEMAEGQGPDILSVPNYWLLRNTKKLTPLSPKVFSPQQFDQTFVSVATKDAVLTDLKNGQKEVYGLPMAVDTLALYYNKALYEDRVPERGHPAATWAQFKNDVYKLTKPDNSFERFEVSGTAMGRSDNIARAIDILYTLMLQYKIKFYNNNYTRAEFAKQQAINDNGTTYNPATEALKLYTSFGLASQKNYSWNKYMVSTDSPVKEVEPFARGKVATIFGYSYLYKQIQNEIAQLKKQGVKTIDFNNVRTSLVPQVYDPTTSTNKRDAFANYYMETVSRNTKNPKAAWDFLLFITSKKNAQYYIDKTKRPPARRDLIDAYKADPIYGVFAEQVGYAESIPVYNFDSYSKIFSDAITSVINTTPVNQALTKAENSINALIPPTGLLPVVSKMASSSINTSSKTK